MAIAMKLLLAVDAFRSYLIKKIAPDDSRFVIKEDRPFDIANVDSYLDDGDETIALVHRDILAGLVVYACLTAREHIGTPSEDCPLFTINVRGSADPSIYSEQILIGDLIEAAKAAQIDHVIEYLLPAALAE